MRKLRLIFANHIWFGGSESENFRRFVGGDSSGFEAGNSVVVIHYSVIVSFADEIAEVTTQIVSKVSLAILFSGAQPLLEHSYSGFTLAMLGPGVSGYVVLAFTGCLAVDTLLEVGVVGLLARLAEQ